MSSILCRATVRSTIVLPWLLVSLGCGSTPEVSKDAVQHGTKDQRTPVVLSMEGQQAVLHEMRQMLTAIGGVLSAAARVDTTAALAALAPAGSAAAADPALEALLPAPWKELAERTHGGFDSLAASVRRAQSATALKDTVLAGVARINESCNACHETYRITVR